MGVWGGRTPGGDVCDYDFFRNSQKFTISSSSASLKTNVNVATGSVVITFSGETVPQPGQGMDTKELSLLIDSICRCNGVVWCPLWCPLGPQNEVHSNEKVELDENSEICEIVHSA